MNYDQQAVYYLQQQQQQQQQQQPYYGHHAYGGAVYRDAQMPQLPPSRPLSAHDLLVLNGMQRNTEQARATANGVTPFEPMQDAAHGHSRPVRGSSHQSFADGKTKCHCTKCRLKAAEERKRRKALARQERRNQMGFFRRMIVCV